MKKTAEDMDIVQRVRLVREKMHHEFKTIGAFGEHMRMLDREDKGIRFARLKPMEITSRAAARLRATGPQVREPAARYRKKTRGKSG